MTYKDILKKQIQELEEKIASQQGERDELVKQLTRLKLAEFEEDMVSEGSQQTLLKG
jgi:cell division protein FtsL